MRGGGVNKIVLGCNTAHVFLREIESRVPECRGKILDMITYLGKDIASAGIRIVSLLASEGTLETKVYDAHFLDFGINVVAPKNGDFVLLRQWIEDVKQNRFLERDLQSFRDYMDGCKNEALVLGCTELPILLREACKNGWKPKCRIFDPLESVISILKKEYGNSVEG